MSHSKSQQNKRNEKRREQRKKSNNGRRRDFTRESSVGSVYFAIL
jgi:hypothetical protein